MSEFVSVEWFGRKDKIGIVLTYDKFDGFKARMAPLPTPTVVIAGIVMPDTGRNSEEFDTKYLMEHAAKIPFDWAWGIFGRRMVAHWQDKHLELNEWPTVRYDHRDYDINTLEEIQ